jgi:hypothetical protein
LLNRGEAQRTAAFYLVNKAEIIWGKKVVFAEELRDGILNKFEMTQHFPGERFHPKW